MKVHGTKMEKVCPFLIFVQEENLDRASELLRCWRRGHSVSYTHLRIVKEADEQAGKIIDNARKTVELDREKAVRGMEKEVANLALVAVSKMLGEQKNAAANQAPVSYTHLDVYKRQV